MKEIRNSLNEITFTNICKHGFIPHKSSISGIFDVFFNREDIKKLAKGEIIEKNADDAVLKFALQDIGLDIIREVLKRSPIFSEISEEI